MKKIITAFLAGTLALGAATPSFARDIQRDDRPAATAKYQSHDHDARKPSQQEHRSEHRFSKGDHFDREHASNYKKLDHHDYARLKTPPRGYEWVRSGNDALLIGVTSGIVSAVVQNMF